MSNVSPFVPLILFPVMLVSPAPFSAFSALPRTDTDLSSVKPRVESRRSKNNSSYTTPPRPLNESGLHGDLSSCSISFKPLGQSWTNSTSNYSPKDKTRQSPTGRLLHPLRYWVLRYQNYNGQDGKLTLLK